VGGVDQISSKTSHQYLLNWWVKLFFELTRSWFFSYSNTNFDLLRELRIEHYNELTIFLRWAWQISKWGNVSVPSIARCPCISPPHCSTLRKTRLVCVL
jgi:hypothetical protein